ncbi:MAG TPA: hypothetical protein VE964_04450 [Myxococcales bacterium]|nr:hypothetical protein [Myxococcales bacterium]
MKKILSFAPLAALFLCGCEVPNKNAGLVVATKVIQATASTTGSSGNVCTYSTDTQELTFGIFNPLAGGYTHGLVIENRLPDNSDLSPGRVNTNDFQVEYAVISYGQIDGPAVVLPPQTVPGNALVLIGTKGVTQLNLVPTAIAQAIGGNTMKVRIYAQVYGMLLDGTRVHTNAYEYVVQADPAFVLPAPTCTAPAAPFACEGVNQDTGTGCK